MKRTIRLLAAPAAALLLLAACSGVPEENPTTEPASAADADADADADPGDNAADDGETDATPSEEGDEPAEGDAIEDGGDSDVAEFAGEKITLDVDAVVEGKVPTRGTFYLEGMTGVKALAEVGAQGPTELEALRESVGADPVSYVRFDVDNREGTEEIGMYNFAMYDDEGNEYLFTPITDNTNDWLKDIDTLNDEQWDLNEALYDADLGGNAAVGQRNEQWLIGPGDLPDEVAIVSATAETFADEFVPFPVK